MVNEFWKNLAKIIHLRSIIGYNGLVFALKKTPVIGKLIPDRLYSTTFLKVIYLIFHIIVEVFKLFIGKIFGLGMIYLAAFLLSDQYIEHELGGGMSRSAVCGNLGLFMFLLYALCGILIRVPYFNCTTEKEYLVFMLRMDAKYNYMTVPAALRELEKIEMVRRNKGQYRLDHAVSKKQKVILSSFGLSEADIKGAAEDIGKKLLMNQSLLDETQEDDDTEDYEDGTGTFDLFD